MSTRLFMILMSIPVTVTFLKVFFLAYKITVADFVSYAAYAAIAAVPSSLLSWGIVEGSIKKFTRLTASGNSQELRSSLKSDLSALALRVIAFGSLAMLAAPIASIPLSAAAGLSFLTATNVFSGSLASLIRAIGDLRWLVLFNVVRVTLASTAAVTVAFWASWQIILLVEGVIGLCVVFSTSLVVFVRKLGFKPRRSTFIIRPTKKTFFLHAAPGGFHLFWAFLLASVPMSVDRYFVLHYGVETATRQYAFLAIWITGAYTLVSIVAQKFGPEAVRSELLKDDRAHIANLVRTAASASGFLLLMSLLSFAGLWLVFPEHYWAKYQLSMPLAVLTSFAGAIQVAHLLDWVLISFDRERGVLAGAFLFVGTCAALFALAAVLKLGTAAYLGALLVARVLQIFLLSVLLRQEIRLRSEQ